LRFVTQKSKDAGQEESSATRFDPEDPSHAAAPSGPFNSGLIEFDGAGPFLIKLIKQLTIIALVVS
jgi:hypothetical protein